MQLARNDWQPRRLSGRRCVPSTCCCQNRLFITRVTFTPVLVAPWGINACLLVTQLDRREAELRAEQHRQRAEQAQAALWEQGGIARAVRSQLLLSEVLAEREAQMAERAYLAGIAEAQEGQYLAQLQERLQVVTAAKNMPDLCSTSGHVACPLSCKLWVSCTNLCTKIPRHASPDSVLSISFQHIF